MLNLLSGQIGQWLLALLYSLPGILIGLVFHEFAHALVADRLGDPTPRMSGRISLNPFAHLDPIGFVMLIIAGFGWAKPVMTNPARYKIKRHGFALVGIAGPITNMLLMVIFIVLYYKLPAPVFVSNIIKYAAYINAALFVFNLIPIPPLDGYNIAKDLFLIKHVNPKSLWNFERYGQFILIGFIMLSSIGGFSIIGNVAGWVVGVFDNLYHLIW